MTTSYPSNLTQDQWELLSSLLAAAKSGGRPRRVDLQAVVNAILYVLCVVRLQQVRHRVSRLVRIWVDGGYSGVEFSQWVMDTYRWVFETVLRTDKVKGLVPAPQRWKVERTFGWFNWCRRLSKDYEILPETAEAFIYIANIRLMLRRLA